MAEDKKQLYCCGCGKEVSEGKFCNCHKTVTLQRPIIPGSESLVSKDVARERILKDEAYGASHGANEEHGYLGTGILYYAMAYMWKASFCVCLGSGSGFVPRLMRQAQRDMGIADVSETVLVDANLPGQWGTPDYHDGGCFFTDNFDVKILKETTEEAKKHFKPGQIEYLHIDADHSYKGVAHDLYAYSDFMARGRVITMHDSAMNTAGVKKLVKELGENPHYDVVNLFVGMGVAVVRVLSEGEK